VTMADVVFGGLAETMVTLLKYSMDPLPWLPLADVFSGAEAVAADCGFPAVEVAVEIIVVIEVVDDSVTTEMTWLWSGGTNDTPYCSEFKPPIAAPAVDLRPRGSATAPLADEKKVRPRPPTTIMRMRPIAIRLGESSRNLFMDPLLEAADIVLDSRTPWVRAEQSP